jgi:hypothetical protein
VTCSNIRSTSRPAICCPSEIDADQISFRITSSTRYRCRAGACTNIPTICRFAYGSTASGGHVPDSRVPEHQIRVHPLELRVPSMESAHPFQPFTDTGFPREAEVRCKSAFHP